MKVNYLLVRGNTEPNAITVPSDFKKKMHNVKMFYSQNVSDILFFIRPACMCYNIYFDEMNGKKDDSRNKN